MRARAARRPRRARPGAARPRRRRRSASRSAGGDRRRRRPDARRRRARSTRPARPQWSSPAAAPPRTPRSCCGRAECPPSSGSAPRWRPTPGEAALLAVDGTTGEVVVDPDPPTLGRLPRAGRGVDRRRDDARRRADEPAVTRDGTTVLVGANVGSRRRTPGPPRGRPRRPGPHRVLLPRPAGAPRTSTSRRRPTAAIAEAMGGRRDHAAHPRRRRRQAAGLPADAAGGQPVPRGPRHPAGAGPPAAARRPAARRSCGSPTTTRSTSCSRWSRAVDELRRGPPGARRRGRDRRAGTPRRAAGRDHGRGPGGGAQGRGVRPARSTSSRSAPTTSPSTPWPPSAATTQLAALADPLDPGVLALSPRPSTRATGPTTTCSSRSAVRWPATNGPPCC